MTNPRAPTEVPSTSSISFRLVVPKKKNERAAKLDVIRLIIIAPGYHIQEPSMLELLTINKTTNTYWCTTLLLQVIGLCYFYGQHVLYQVSSCHHYSYSCTIFPHPPLLGLLLPPLPLLDFLNKRSLLRSDSSFKYNHHCHCCCNIDTTTTAAAATPCIATTPIYQQAKHASSGTRENRRSWIGDTPLGTAVNGGRKKERKTKASQLET